MIPNTIKLFKINKNQVFYDFFEKTFYIFIFKSVTLKKKIFKYIIKFLILLGKSKFFFLMIYKVQYLYLKNIQYLIIICRIMDCIRSLILLIFLRLNIL